MASTETLRRIAHPKDGEANLLQVAKDFMCAVHKHGVTTRDDIIVSKIRNFSKFAEQWGIEQRHRPNFILLLNLLGLAQFVRGGTKNSYWKIAPRAVVDQCTDKDLETALAELSERQRKQKADRRQKPAAVPLAAEGDSPAPVTVKKKKKAATDDVPDAAALLADAVEVAEGLQVKLAVAEARIAELEALLAKRPVDRELVKRVLVLKKKFG